MKKILLLAALLLSVVCCYDDSRLWEEIDSVKLRVSALETVQNAYKDNLYIKSVNQIDNHYIITFSDNSTVTIVNGSDGIDSSDGVTLIDKIVIGDTDVTFILSDGNSFTMLLYSGLSVEFDTECMVAVSPNSTRQISYAIKSVLVDEIEVEVVSSADIKAKVLSDQSGSLTGKIEIHTGGTIDEYTKVVVLVSNGEKVVMKTLKFEEERIEVVDEVRVVGTAEGGIVELLYLSNVECEVVIPEDAKNWISVAPATRAMETHTITLKLEPNEGYYRSTTVTVQSPDGSLKLEYTIEQEGDLGVKIDPTQIPDNEIWYRTNGDVVFTEFQTDQPFNSNIRSNEYKHGYGIIKCDNSITRINEFAFANVVSNITELYLPNSIEYLGDAAIWGIGATTLHIPSSLKVIEGRFYVPNMTEFTGEHVSEDGRCIIIDGVLCAFAPKGAEEYTIPLNIHSIGDWAFYGHPIRKIEFSENVRVIGRGAFEQCEQLTTVVLNNGCEKIGEDAFRLCFNLKDINLPSSLKSIGGWAFQQTSIEVITIPDNIDYIGPCAFFFCEKLREFRGQFASDDGMFLSSEGKMFAYAIGAGLDEYSIPEGIAMVENYTFANDKNLRRVIIPSSMRIVRGAAFQACDALEYIGGPYASEDNKCLIIDGHMQLFAGKGITEYTIPNYVIEIEGGIFSYNQELVTLMLTDSVESVGVDKVCGATDFIQHSQKLKTITLSARLKSFGYGFFHNCSSLETIYCRAIIPPDLSEVNISDMTPMPTIYVPSTSINLYYNSNDWLPFKNYIKPFSYTDLPVIDYYISTDYTQDGKVTTLQTATIGNGIDIVLMGDAYSDRQIADGTYEADMENLYNNLFTEEPYKSFKDHFNVYYVNAVSATEGYEHEGSAFGGYFGDGTLVGGNDNAVFSYALNAISEEEMDEALIIVAMNSDAYAGTCYMYYPESATGTYGSGPAVAYFPKGGDEETLAQLLHHEANGHGFAKLADEYAYEDMGEVPGDYVSEIRAQQNSWGWWKNVDFISDLSAVRWNYFINDTRYANEGLGAYEGGLTYWSGVWRPTEDSIMRYNTGGFNAPSREAIYYRIHKLAYGDSWEYDYEDFVEYDAVNRSTSTSAPQRTRRNYVERLLEPTTPPVVVGKSWKDVR